MKRLLSFALVVLVLAALSGCGRKQEIEELQPITMESLSTATGSTQTAPDLRAQEVKAAAITPAKELVPLPPQGPYKPAAVEIQTALKNAGFYTGNLDGKIGPKSKKAIEAFQTANGLKADGKVGPKTWEAMGKYLTPVVEPAKR